MVLKQFREPNDLEFARATFNRKELPDYLEASKLIEKKIDFLCQTDQEIENYVDYSLFPPVDAA